MAEKRRRRVPQPRRHQDDSVTLGSEEDDNASEHSDARSHSDAESDTIFDKEEEDTDEYESAEEAQGEVGEALETDWKSKPPEDGGDDDDQEEEEEQDEGSVEDGKDEEDEDAGDNENAEPRDAEEGEKGKEGEESQENLDADQDLKNPAYIPRRGPYYMHDVRTMDAKEEDKEEQRPTEKKLWKEDNRWLHDKYIEEEQAPKPRAEMMAVYGYDIRSSNEPPKTGYSRQRRRSPRGQRQDRGRRRYNPRDQYDNRDRYDQYRSERPEKSDPTKEERNIRNKQRAAVERREERQDGNDDNQGQNNEVVVEHGKYNHEQLPWSGRSRGRGRGRGGRGQGRERQDRSSQNTTESAPIPHKTEWINSSTAPNRRGGLRKERQQRQNTEPDRPQRVPVMEDFPPLASEAGGQEPTHPPPRETRSYQRDRRQRATAKQEPTPENEAGDWAGVVVQSGRMNVNEDSREESFQDGSNPTKSQGLLPTPLPTGGAEQAQESISAAERAQGDKREPPRPKRYSSQRQRQPADAPPVSQASVVLNPPKFYQSGQSGPPPGYQRQVGTPPATSSPQQMGGGATPPHTLPNTAPSMPRGATPPGMGVVVPSSSQGPPGVLPGGVMPQGILLQGDVPMHAGMQHPSPTHIANPSIIHPAAMRPQPPLPQGTFPPPPHFMVNYRASPGQQYQLNSPVPIQQFPPVSVPNITPHSQPPPLQPHPIPPHPAIPQPNQSLPLQVQPMLAQQTPAAVQPLLQGGSGPLPAEGSGQSPGQPPSQTYGGVTYYSPEQQQQGVKRVQPKRAVNPIRIEEPPQRSKRHPEQYQENQDEMTQQHQQGPQLQQLQQQQQQQQQQVVEGGTT